ncbi:hypothetical protein RRSWK_02615 [Rhodopirellula sp. SWK7]|nr:hypothetical protein RRSWK_02615 [Rhodopirellula sp. SWK7]
MRESHLEPSNLQPIALTEPGGLLDSCIINENAVPAAQVLDVPTRLVAGQSRVSPARPATSQNDLVFRRSTQDHLRWRG